MVEPPPQVGSSPSVFDSISRALDWAGQVLFHPFDLGKWFTLGFCAWLAWLGERGSGAGFHNWNLDREEAHDRMGYAHEWALAHLALIITLGIILLFFCIVLWILFTWLSSRGKFMFLDGVIRNRGAVVEPWHRFREAGNSLFFFRIVLTLVSTVVMLVTAGFMVLGLFAMGIDDHRPSAAVLVFLVISVAVLLALAFGIVLLVMTVNDFVVPVMWLRGCRVMEAWREVLALLTRELGSFIAYVLMKIVILIVVVGISCVAVCVTCCAAAIPYLGTVILLPIYVFQRSFSIYFLAQFGPDYAPLAPAMQLIPGEPRDAR